MRCRHQAQSQFIHRKVWTSQERARQRKEMDAVLRDRDVLGSQLVRRNDELALLYEKIRLQQSTISQGNAAYRCAPDHPSQAPCNVD